MTIDRYLYLTRDRSRVVEEGDPAATSSLWAAPGHIVSRRDALLLGAIPPDPIPEPKPTAGLMARQSAVSVNRSRAVAARTTASR